MTKKRAVQLLLLVAGLGIFFVLSRHWPKEQTVHLVLGDAAPRVEELAVRYGEAVDDRQGQRDDGVAEWAREAELHYAPGKAPRIVTQTPRLADGDWIIEIDVSTRGGRSTLKKRVKLEGGATSIDVSRSVPQ